MTGALACEALRVAPGDTALIDALDFACGPGEIVAVLGVNGAGKTSLLETLCGLRAPAGGRVTLDGADLATLSRRDIARRVALMPQTVEDSFVQQVLPLVAIGRYASRGFWQWRDDTDLGAARRALARVGLAGFEARWTESLSGGERQRVALAMILAQAPQILLLDEPFSQLDPYHQLAMARLLRGLRDDGHGIVMSVHDMNLAAHCADRALLLFGDGRTLAGNAGEVLTDTHLSTLYATPVRSVGADGQRQFSFF